MGVCGWGGEDELRLSNLAQKEREKKSMSFFPSFMSAPELQAFWVKG